MALVQIWPKEAAFVHFKLIKLLRSLNECEVVKSYCIYNHFKSDSQIENFSITARTYITRPPTVKRPMDFSSWLLLHVIIS